MMYRLYLLLRSPWFLLPGAPEWSERWGSWPHCNGQARCWMHYGPARRWCECSCGYCRIARLVRRDGGRP